MHQILKRLHGRAAITGEHGVVSSRGSIPRWLLPVAFIFVLFMYHNIVGMGRVIAYIDHSSDKDSLVYDEPSSTTGTDDDEVVAVVTPDINNSIDVTDATDAVAGSDTNTSDNSSIDLPVWNSTTVKVPQQQHVQEDDDVSNDGGHKKHFFKPKGGSSFKKPQPASSLAQKQPSSSFNNNNNNNKRHNNNTAKKPFSKTKSISVNNDGSNTQLQKATAAVEFLGIQPRSWDPWWPSSSSPTTSQTLCYDPGPKLVSARTQNKELLFPVGSNAFDKSRMFRRGLVFVKPMKVGGSSATGVNLRISKNMASRLHKPFMMCENNFDHAMGWMYKQRNKKESFLWTLLRDPTKRAVSGFWHFLVSRENVAPTLDNLVRELEVYTHFYLRMHSLSPLAPEKKPQKKSNNNSSSSSTTAVIYKDDDYFRRIANQIMKDYDFMAVTERFDESMVVLNMLLNEKGSGSNGIRVQSNDNRTMTAERYVPLGDMLYVKAKTKGGFDDGGGRSDGKCTYIQPSNVTAEMQAYIDSDEWRRRVRWDEALWHAANRSLDLTIDRLGRSKFEHKLALYRKAQRLVNDRCRSHAKVPCETTGYKRKPDQTNCLFQDSGCAWECIDQMVVEWNANVSKTATANNATTFESLDWL
jgi:hypothetical protein